MRLRSDLTSLRASDQGRRQEPQAGATWRGMDAEPSRRAPVDSRPSDPRCANVAQMAQQLGVLPHGPMLVAVLLSPLLAVQAQKWLELLRERRSRKLAIFNALMGTRAQRLSFDHVQALNMIDIDFYGHRLLGFRFQSGGEKAVISSWKTYLDHLNQPFNEAAHDAWLVRSNDLFTDLLFEMSRALGYDFDKVHLKRSIYSPRAHGEQETLTLELRDGLRRVLSGERHIPIELRDSGRQTASSE